MKNVVKKKTLFQDSFWELICSVSHW